MMSSKFYILTVTMIGVLMISLAARNGDVLLINVFLSVYLLVSLFQTTVRDKIKISAKRTVECSFDGIITRILVAVTLKNDTDRKLFLVVRDNLPDNAIVIDGKPGLCALLKHNQEAEIRYTLHAQRGLVQWEMLPLTVMDPLECFQQSVSICAPALICIPPQFRRMKTFNPYPRHTVSIPGIIPTKRSGGGTDFYGIREYHSGDPVRKLDWKMTERHPHKYYMREYEQESNAEIAIVVDGRKRMDLRIGDESVFESQIKLAASMCEMLIRQGNRVGLSVVGDNNQTIPPGYGKRQLHRLLNGLAVAQPGENGYRDEIHTFQRRRFSSKAQFFFISPYDYHDLEFYRNLKAGGYQIILISPDTYKVAFSDMDLSDQNNLPLRMSVFERKLNLRFLTEMSIPVIDWDIKQPIAQPLMSMLMMAGRKRRW